MIKLGPQAIKKINPDKDIVLSPKAITDTYFNLTYQPNPV